MRVCTGYVSLTDYLQQKSVPLAELMPDLGQIFTHRF